MNAVAIPQEELFDLCAVDPILYCRTFFPQTVRQDTPPFHVDFWQKLEDPTFDFFGAEVFRGGAKTTLARLALSRRIAYAISRNILSIGISETMSVLTSRWLKKQVEHNTLWAQTFKLSKGPKWTDEHFEVHHGIEDCLIPVVAKGMTSGLRGLNLDDYRPDLIYCDDICNEENTKTEEGLKKINDLIFGALVPSLAPKSEAPNRKFVLTNTAITKDDPIVRAHSDPAFQTVRYSKIYIDAEGNEQSAWPTRWTLEECLREKAEYTRRRQLYIWLREFGCKIVGSGETAFQPTWLLNWQVLPARLDIYIGLDPARSKLKTAHKCAIVVIGVNPATGDVYILETFAQKGPNPEEIWNVLSRMVRQWRPRKVAVETIAYQQMLAWYLRQKMTEERFYFTIIEVEDRRSKPDRINQAYNGIGSNGRLHAHENHVDFRAAFEEWTTNMDSDILDAGAMAICQANPWMLIGQNGTTFDQNGKAVDPIREMEKDIPDLDMEMGAP